MSQTSVADLELTLRPAQPDGYAVELRFTLPDSDADVRLSQGSPALARFDFTQLRARTLDMAEYGRHLSASLFADPSLRAAFHEARSLARTQHAPLRLRLFI